MKYDHTIDVTSCYRYSSVHNQEVATAITKQISAEYREEYTLDEIKGVCLIDIR